VCIGEERIGEIKSERDERLRFLGDSGVVSRSRIKGHHDDRVMALSLANLAAAQEGIGDILFL
jgi:hypothetical protein